MRILDLGCGDLANANSMLGEVLAIDRKITATPAPNVTTMIGDYFDMQLNGEFDWIYANYSLCFNSQERIEKQLPKILEHLKTGGTFEVKDFYTDDTIVTKRTNLFAQWFFDLVDKNVGHPVISDEYVFEKKHSHEHHIFQLKAVKTMNAPLI